MYWVYHQLIRQLESLATDLQDCRQISMYRIFRSKELRYSRAQEDWNIVSYDLVLKFCTYFDSVWIKSFQEISIRIITFLSTCEGLCLRCKEITEFIHGNTNRWFIIWIIAEWDTTRCTLSEKTIKIITKYSSTLLTRWLSRWKISRCKRIITRKRRKGKRSSTNREGYYEWKNIFSKFLFHRKNLLSPITPHIVWKYKKITWTTNDYIFLYINLNSMR